MLKEVGHIKNTVVLIFWHIQCLRLMYSDVAWVWTTFTKVFT